MLRLLTDEDFNHSILRGLLLRRADIDVVRAQDVGLTGQKDPAVLEWAARNGRILLTHDVNTMVAQAYARVEASRPMPGVFAIPQSLPIGQAIEEILLLAECSLDGEWEGQIRFLPL